MPYEDASEEEDAPVSLSALARHSKSGAGPFLQLAGGLTLHIPALAMDLALYGEDIDRVAEIYSLSTPELKRLLDTNGALQAELAEAEKVVRARGRASARAWDAYEAHIPTLCARMDDPLVPLDHLTRAMEHLAKIGGLLPTGNGKSGQADGVNVNLPRDILEIPDTTLKIIIESAKSRVEAAGLRYVPPAIDGNLADGD